MKEGVEGRDGRTSEARVERPGMARGCCRGL